MPLPGISRWRHSILGLSFCVSVCLWSCTKSGWTQYTVSQWKLCYYTFVHKFDSNTLLREYHTETFAALITCINDDTDWDRCSSRSTKFMTSMNWRSTWLMSGMVLSKVSSICQGSYRSGKTGKGQGIWVVRESQGKCKSDLKVREILGQKFYLFVQLL